MNRVGTIGKKTNRLYPTSIFYATIVYILDFLIENHSFFKLIFPISKLRIYSAQQKRGTESCLLQARQSLAQNTKAAPRKGGTEPSMFLCINELAVRSRTQKFSELSIQLSR